MNTFFTEHPQANASRQNVFSYKLLKQMVEMVKNKSFSMRIKKEHFELVFKNLKNIFHLFYFFQTEQKKGIYIGK